MNDKEIYKFEIFNKFNSVLTKNCYIKNRNSNDLIFLLKKKTIFVIVLNLIEYIRSNIHLMI